MPEPHLRHGLWLAVCDGNRALLLENTGDAKFPKLEARETFEQTNPSSHEQGSAPPGRVFSSGARRAATEESDFHRQALERFLAKFAQEINRLAAGGDIPELVLIAPLEALGILRRHLSRHAEKIIGAELPRDYTKMPLYEIERRLMEENNHA